MVQQKISKLPLKVVLTASILFLVVGCGCFPKPPDIRPKQILQSKGICKQYIATFGDKLTFKYEKDLTIEECIIDGDFILTDDELVSIRKTYNEAKKCAENQDCKLKVK